jgi:hypothetical protein
MRETGFTEMYLVIDTAGEQPFAFAIYLHSRDIDLWRYFFDTSLVYQQVGRCNAAFVDNLDTFNQIFLHILSPESNLMTHAI